MNAASIRTVPARQRGVGLVEILVAVLILAVGFLGLAGLQTRGLKAAQGSYERSTGTIAAYSLLDAMRANALRSDDVNEQRTRAAAYVTDWICELPATAPTTLAGRDRKRWLENLQAAVRADACGRIVQVDAANLVYRVEVCWPDSGAGVDTSEDNCLGGEPATVLRLESRL